MCSLVHLELSKLSFCDIDLASFVSLRALCCMETLSLVDVTEVPKEIFMLCFPLLQNLFIKNVSFLDIEKFSQYPAFRFKQGVCSYYSQILTDLRNSQKSTQTSKENDIRVLNNHAEKKQNRTTTTTTTNNNDKITKKDNLFSYIPNKVKRLNVVYDDINNYGRVDLLDLFDDNTMTQNLEYLSLNGTEIFFFLCFAFFFVLIRLF